MDNENSVKETFKCLHNIIIVYARKVNDPTSNHLILHHVVNLYMYCGFCGLLSTLASHHVTSFMSGMN